MMAFRILNKSTLRLTFPLGRTILLALAMMGTFVGLCEALVHTPQAREILLPPRLSGHVEIAPKLAMLDEIVERQGGIDCIIVGNSKVLHGIAAEIVAESYKRETGAQISCFNFGISGPNVRAVARLIQALNVRYHPRFFVYGTSFGEFVEGFNSDIEIPWLMEQTGSPSLEGWLEVNLLSYQTYLAYADFQATTGGIAFRQSLTPTGQWPLPQARDVTHRPDPQRFKQYYDILANYHISKSAGTALDHILEMNNTDTSIIILEMPVAPMWQTLLGNGEQDYRGFVDFMTQHTRAANVPFFATMDSGIMPLTLWNNYNYVDQEGSWVLSDWLGKQIALAVKSGRLSDPAR